VGGLTACAYPVLLMQTDIAKKTCKMCCMEIPKEARKCPYCQHFQNRLVMFLYHPAFAVLCASIPFVVTIIVLFSIFDTGANYETYKDQIAITDSQLVLGDTKSGATVDVIGTITNASLISWKEIHIHVDFLDAGGKRIDVGEKENYNSYLPAHGTSSFKVSFVREFPETNYVKHVVRVVTAKDARERW
jgi:hypothetical protein